MQDIKTVIKTFKPQCLDYRDFKRLSDFLTPSEFKKCVNV